MRKLRALLGDLSRSRRQAGRRDVPRRRAWQRTDRCAGASWRRLAGECAPGRSQRGHAGWAGSGRWRHSPMVLRQCAFSLRANPRHDVAGLSKTIALAEPILAGLGFTGARVATIETDDPDALGEALRAIAPDGRRSQARHVFGQPAASATCMRLRLRELHRGSAGAGRRHRAAGRRAVRHGRGRMSKAARCASPACRPARPARFRTIPSGRCCASPKMPACNAGFARRPARRRSSALKPQIDFRAATAMSRVIKQEEPSECIRCGKPFGVKSTVERVIAKLEGKHWMYQRLKQTARRHPNVRGLPRRGNGRRAIRSVRRAGAPAPAHDRRLFARARGKGRELITSSSSSSSPLSPRIRPAPDGLRPTRSSARASWCRAYNVQARSRTISKPSLASIRS